ncbi:MAG: SGNH/GDSL hydrolase family protein [Candidatus Thiodiazotropha sp.]
MVWFHDKCVGLGKDEPVGMWMCLSCRDIPQIVKSDVISLKNDVKQLKECTQSILTAVSVLSSKLESCIGGINDRLTALNKQINVKDKALSVSLENLTSTTDGIKSQFEHRSIQILNKTNAVLDKVKPKVEVVKNTTTQAKPSSRTRTNPSNDHIEPTETTRINESKTTSHYQQITKPRYRNVQKNDNPDPQRKASQQNGSHKTLENETIDLTTNTTKPIHQSTLLVGSSLFKGVRVNELKQNTTVRSFSGARIDTIADKLSQYNIENCKTIILHVGGNDADSGVDLDSFSENYVSLLNDLSANNRRIIVSGLLPRESVDLKPYNQKLKTICEENGLDFIDNYDNFLLASGEVPESFFQQDKLHLNASGTRRLLSNIDKVHRVTKFSPRSNITRPSQGFRKGSNNYRGSNNFKSGSNHNRSYKRFCHICTKNGHNTQECWYNGRGTQRARSNW